MSRSRHVAVYTASPAAASTCEIVSSYKADDAPVSSPDPGWLLVGATAQHSFYYFDKNITTKAGKTAVWTMSNYRDMQPGQSTQTYAAYRSLLERTVIECSERSAGVTQRTYYVEPFGKGEVAGSWQAIQSPVMSYAIPNTLGDMLITAVCARK